jgi:hypothetical protein
MNEELLNAHRSVAANTISALDLNIDGVEKLLHVRRVQVDRFVKENTLHLQTDIVFRAVCISVDIGGHLCHVPLTEPSAYVSERLHILMRIKLRDLAHVVNIWPPPR